MPREGDVFRKCFEFDLPRVFKSQGIYPYFRVMESGQEAEAVIDGRKVVMLGSNNYLGLTSHPKVKESAMRALEKYGSGCTGSRFLNGTLDIHVELEERLAEFLGKEACLVFSTGYQTNLGTISAIVDRGDFAITDRENHASIVDGTRLSHGKVLKFRHNSPEDLRRVLSDVDSKAGKLVIVEGVYSTKGDVSDLPSIIEVSRNFGARVMVDDAHGFGVLGERGSGTHEHFGVTDDVDLIMITFSKSLASIGGAVAGKKEVIEYIKHRSRPFIFTASLPPASVGAVLAALEVIREEPERRARLLENSKVLREELKKLGFNVVDGITPIVSIVVGKAEVAFKMGMMLFHEGVFVNPMVSPAVPQDESLIRMSLVATHTREHIEITLTALERVGKALSLI